MVAELRLMEKDHPEYEDDIPQFSGKINEKFVEWVYHVRLWEAEHKDERKPHLGPRLYWRLPEQPNQTIKTLLGQGDPANFTVQNTIETLRNGGYGDTLDEKSQEVLDKHLGTRQGKAEAIRDHVNREEMMSLSLQNSTRIALDQRMLVISTHQHHQSKSSQVSESSPKGAPDCPL